MAIELIKPGIAVITRGGVAGVIDSVSRHPVTRRVLAVLVQPVGVTDRDDFVMAGIRHLRPVPASA